MKTIGILGGMGPLATAELFQRIVQKSDAVRDSEHIHVVIDNNTRIPDRTAAILGEGPSPLPELVRSALGLEGMGADLLVMPCNTAHYFYDDLLAFVRVPILHMIRETRGEMHRLGVRRAALLATDGTCRSGLYDREFADSGIELIHPGEEDQTEVMSIIYRGVKAGAAQYNTTAFQRVLARLDARGAETMILGCTELPLAFQRYGICCNSVNPGDILADAAVRAARSDALCT